MAFPMNRKALAVTVEYTDCRGQRVRTEYPTATIAKKQYAKLSAAGCNPKLVAARLADQ